MAEKATAWGEGSERQDCSRPLARSPKPFHSPRPSPIASRPSHVHPSPNLARTSFASILSAPQTACKHAASVATFNRLDPTVPGWRCSYQSSFASRLIQRLHAGSPSLCWSLGTAIFACMCSSGVGAGRCSIRHTRPLLLADARSATLFACAPPPPVLADAQSATFLACAPPPPMLADARSATFLACAPQALVLADARSTTLLALAPLTLLLPVPVLSCLCCMCLSALIRSA